MLQNIVFQDNLYHLSRSIDLTKEGILLDLSSEYFFDKLLDDILFFDITITKIYRQLSENSRISGYVQLLHSVHSCQRRYIQLLESIPSLKTSLKDDFVKLIPKIRDIHVKHKELSSRIVDDIAHNDPNSDSRDVVSQSELSELLNF